MGRRLGVAELDGIYVGYMSAAEGYSAVLFVLREGRMTGADVGGGTYSGSYEVTDEGLLGTAIATMPPNSQSITGAQVGADGYTFSVPFQIRMAEIGRGYIVLDTPSGPVSAAINKLQELP